MIKHSGSCSSFMSCHVIQELPIFNYAAYTIPFSYPIYVTLENLPYLTLCLQVNGFDVRAASHDYTVRLIKESDVNLTLTILTLHVTPTLTLSRVRAKSQSECDF